MRIIDLFSGIGGFSLAAHWMGWETLLFCEISKFPQQVLRKNFPGVFIHEDILTLNKEILWNHIHRKECQQEANCHCSENLILTAGFP